MSGFKSYGEEDFDRVFITDNEIIERFYGRGLWSWGSQPQGQLGIGSTTARSSPGTVAGGGVNWAQVSQGSGRQLDFSTNEIAQFAAIKTDGTLWTWGPNNSGQLGDGTTTNRSSPGTTAGGGTDWKQVAIGGGGGSAFVGSTLAVKTDGTLWSWGANGNGQLGTGNTTSRGSPGTTAGGGTNWKQAACGYGVSAAVKTDGTLWTWGSSASGGVGAGNLARSSPGTIAGGGTNWKQVSISARGGAAAAAVKTDGTLWTWGNNQNGSLGTGNTTDRSSPGTTVGGGTTWKQVSQGILAGAVKTDGTLWMWGRNDNGGVGDGTTSERSSPVTTAVGGTNWKQVSCAAFGAAAVKTDGTIWTWGVNTSGQLGNGTTTSSRSPITPTIGAQTKWKSVTMGATAAIAIADY